MDDELSETRILAWGNGSRAEPVTPIERATSALGKCDIGPCLLENWLDQDELEAAAAPQCYCVNHNDGDADDPIAEFSMDGSKAIWQAMIDVALMEGSGGG